MIAPNDPPSADGKPWFDVPVAYWAQMMLGMMAFAIMMAVCIPFLDRGINAATVPVLVSLVLMVATTVLVQLAFGWSGFITGLATALGLSFVLAIAWRILVMVTGISI